METNVNYTVVGAFVISLLTIMIVIIIWLSAGLSFQKYTNYEVYMRESVSGLSPDSPVEFNGVNVGSVKKIEIDEKNPRLVALLLAIKSNTPITEGTTATLNVRGLTGIAFVALTDRGNDTRPLIVAKEQLYPIIKTAPSFFMQLDTAVTKLTNNVHEVSRSLQSLLDKDNLQNVKQVLSNLQQVTETLATNRQQFSTITHTFAIETLPSANQAIANVDSLTANLSSVSKEIKNNPSVLIRGKSQQTLGPGE